MKELNEIKVSLLKLAQRVTTALVEQELKIAACVTLCDDDCNKNGKSYISLVSFAASGVDE